jgi:hypothetical protein
MNNVIKKILSKITPLSFLGGFVLLYVIITIEHASHLHGGEDDLEYIVNSITYFPFYLLIATAALCLIFPVWSKKYWFVIALLLLVGLLPVISFLADKYIYNEVNCVLFTPFGYFE